MYIFDNSDFKREQPFIKKFSLAQRHRGCMREINMTDSTEAQMFGYNKWKLKKNVLDKVEDKWKWKICKYYIHFYISCFVSGPLFQTWENSKPNSLDFRRESVVHWINISCLLNNKWLLPYKVLYLVFYFIFECIAFGCERVGDDIHSYWLGMSNRIPWSRALIFINSSMKGFRFYLKPVFKLWNSADYSWPPVRFLII